MVPVGKGAKDLAQPSFMTSRSSEITTDPSAAIPQYNFTPPSEPCKIKPCSTYTWIIFQDVNFFFGRIVTKQKHDTRELIKSAYIPVQQRHCQPCCHRQQRQSFHQGPSQLDLLGMDHGHEESYKLQSQTWPHQYPLTNHIAWWVKTSCSGSPRRGSICHQAHRTSCKIKCDLASKLSYY